MPIGGSVAWLVLAVLGLVVLPHDDRSYSQTYPSRAVRLINPFPPGGAVDVMARVWRKKVSDNLDNGSLLRVEVALAAIFRSEYVAKSPPDGFTSLFTASGYQMVAPPVH